MKLTPRSIGWRIAHPLQYAEMVGRKLRIARLNRIRGVRIHPESLFHKTAAIEHMKPGRVEIAKNATIERGVLIAPHEGFVTIGEEVFVGPYCILYGNGGLTIGPHTLIAGHTVIVPGSHVFFRTDVPIESQGMTSFGITIERDCWIGCGCRILDGVTIGEGSVIGAGTVVNKSIPPYSVAVGVPARIIKNRKDANRVRASFSVMDA